jgi:predicted negative regulator of RcsB-dependent stress response
MESQDTATLYLFKLWPAIEANKKRILWGAVALLLVVLLVLFFSWQKDQKEINAGQAYSQMLVSLQPNDNPAELATQYLKVAGDYPGTEAGLRAQLQGAADLFTAGNYAEAQTQFQKFADENPNNSMVAIAALGVAACIEAQGKPDAALDSYKKVIDDYSDLPTQISAKFAVARLYEQQGKITDAIRYYDEVSRSASGSTLGQQASLKSVELKTSLPAPTQPSFTPTAPAMNTLAMPPSK